ncbi:MAG TPA: DUF2281 domain-containing protein [Desulfobacteria bacterium]|nr:DUF2281 domain-containing protein [Desulfobacteria bacterium]
MAAKDAILHELEQLPEPYLQEILDFIRLLKAKDSERNMKWPS